MLHINDLVYRQNGRLLFSGATLHVAEGQHLGLIGRNGSGKTTLFRLILGEAGADGGDIRLRPRVRLGHVAQDMPSGEVTPLEIVLAADDERTSLLAEAETETDAHRIADIHQRLADIDSHGAPSRAGAILAGLGFDAPAQERPISEFSGGWRMRVALARTLFTKPDLLLLDEPTNHLDLEAVLWLTSHLASWQGTMVLISHDRDLLNAVANRITHIEGGKLNAYQGNFDRFERTRRERLDLQAKAFTKQMEQRRHIQSFIDRFRAKATKARQAQSRMKMLERMELAVPVVEDQPISFDFPEPEAFSPPLIALEDVAIGYAKDHPVLRKLNLRLDPDDRIALLGPNGNGKTTLARLLAGRLAPLSGEIVKPSKLRVGYFAQDQADELDLTASTLDHMRKLAPTLTEEKMRAHLARFGFTADHVDTKVASLSGGEKARLLFALMCRDSPSLMVLDEPTNHLDIDAREALEQALNAFEGAVVLVSHDAHLIELAADKLWRVENGTCTPFDGDLDDYRQSLAEARRNASGGTERTGGGQPSRKDERRQAAEARAKLAPLRQAAKAADAHLAKLHDKKAQLEKKLADPKLYEGPPEKVTNLRLDLGALDRDLADAEAVWLSAHEALEAAES
ncbi:MAG: ABC-F family ATP-binding cassette domain-containing protein [Alphaproteobacteria bacterium]|nr:ABC-F family ATP-binding cassette domain-containing protein [Alphaproteobacteria bacterium]